jgi:solute carrier family 30 (zinc transporter), member 5/7
MLVNLVGVFAFGHHHHGHGHSHDHGHDHGHGHSHDNENMQGIYLHVLADTLGSLSVVVSTALTSVWGWAGWDPLASVFISVLILLSSKPLIVSSARRLLLSIPDGTEYNLREVLAGICQQRGVAACAAPKFWVNDRGGSEACDKLLGIVHVVAARGASLDEVRDGVRNYLRKSGIDITVQVERDGDTSCWCNAGRSATPMTPRLPVGPKQL